MPNRAVLYLRLSSSDDASTAIARQEADLRLRAEREGWEISEDRILVDDGLSGGKSRANADEALAMLRDGRADVLAVWKFDRWSRQGLGALAALIDVLDARPDALFVADRDGLASSQPAWRIIASVLAEVARMERENTRARVLSSLAHLRTSGRYAGGQRPYGYVSADNPDGPGRILVVDEAEAAIVREASERVLSGQTLYSITRDLNARGVRTAREATWSIQALRQILTSDAIVGRAKHRGEVVRDNDGYPVAVWEPVLDLDRWHRVRLALGVGTPPTATRRVRNRRTRLLSGIAACGTCSAPLYVKHNGAGVVSYACTQRSNGRKCPGVSVNAELLEAHVSREFLDAVGDREVFERREILSTSEAELAEVERAISETVAAMAADDADVPALSSRLAALKDRRTDIRSQPTTATVEVAGTGRTFAEAWAAADQDARRLLLAANVAMLTVSKGRRGAHGLDPRRVALIAQPAMPVDAAKPMLPPGRVVVGVEPEAV